MFICIVCLYIVLFYLNFDFLIIFILLRDRAAELQHGQWSIPEFDCDGFVKKWVVHYTAPFFGWDALRSKLEFK